MNNMNLQKHLGYVCKQEKGYANDLIQQIGLDRVKQFETVGFITKGHTLKFGTWRKTKLADRYYKDLYGSFSYLRNKFL